MKNAKHFTKTHAILTRLILINLCCISFIGNASCQEDGRSSEQITNSEKYRYTITHSFRKIGEGDKVKIFYFAVPRTSEYQEISNYSYGKGEFLEDTISNEYYIMWDVSDDMNTESSDWFTFSFEFDCIHKRSEYQTQIMDKIYPYDTTSVIYKRYTKSLYDFIVVDNPTMVKASEEIWERSTDLYDYAKKSLEYINDNFNFMVNPPFDSRSLAKVLEFGSGDCGHFASLFINLCRIKKIPSRQVYFKDHVWAEMYFENYGWIPVDPTYNLFGRASSSYFGQIAWANHTVSNVVDLNGQPMVLQELTNFLHVPLPAHNSYDCDIKISRKIQTE